MGKYFVLYWKRHPNGEGTTPLTTNIDHQNRKISHSIFYRDRGKCSTVVGDPIECLPLTEGLKLFFTFNIG